jgi:hypothetical protein
MSQSKGDSPDLVRENFENLSDVLRARGIHVRAYEAWRYELEHVLAEHPADSDFWIFGYGSLMWNPGIDVVERRPMELPGFQRRFCLWDSFGRGTRDRPGLMLAIQPGGRC